MSALRPELSEALEEFERQRERRDTLRRVLAEQRSTLTGRLHRLLTAFGRMLRGRR